MKLELLTCETVKVATSDAIISTSTSFDGTGGDTGVGGLVGTAGRGGHVLTMIALTNLSTLTKALS